MMWIPLRSAKMNGFILGFQRRVWWPKWMPASRRARIETDGMNNLLRLLPPQRSCREPGVEAHPAPLSTRRLCV
jgi:hypothetical protein